VHRGFLAAFQLLQPELEDELERVNARTKKLLLTGHSLGGALATIAAGEWQGRIPITCFYTYGQPAVGRVSFPAFMAQNYAGKFFRFVNYDDVVPRVPPFYSHIGQLYHFDSSGNLESLAPADLTSATESPSGGPEVPPMLTETQFDHLRAQLLEQRVQARASGMESLVAPMMESIIPSIRDHFIDHYIAKIAAKAGQT
jgi:hypothetical protein